MTNVKKKKGHHVKKRKWLLTINNPLKEEYSGMYEIESIKKAIDENFSTIKYYAYSMEIGAKEKTPHCHIFLEFKSPVVFTQVKRYFPVAHIDIVKGTSAQVRAYVFKEERWENTEKGTTNLRDTHFEWGEVPEGSGEKKTTLSELYEIIKSGKSDLEIMDENPQYIFHLDRIEKVRQKIAEEHYKSIFRELTVIYMWGRTGCGKSSYVLRNHDVSSIHRVTDYQRDPFGSYDTVKHRTIMFDEFRGQLSIVDMLNYLDGHPLEISSRYCNKTAGYDKVYLIGNEPLSSLYTNIQDEKPDTWMAFKRRIDLVINFNELEAMGLNDYDLKNTFISFLEAKVISKKHQSKKIEFMSRPNVRKVAPSLLQELIDGTINQRKLIY